MIERRIGVGLRSLDELRSPGWLRVPTRVIEGRRDTTVRVMDGRRLAASRPNLVRLVVLPHARHTDGWHSDPARYRTALRWLLLTAAP